MPITRSYMCQDCGHYMTVVLTADEWDNPAPACPRCADRQMQQDFKPAAIGGSVRSKAEKLTEDILATDYQVGNIHRDRQEGSTPKVDYKSGPNSSSWGIGREALEAAISVGRQSRLKHGNGLDVLQHNLKTGVEPDLIELSKRRSMRIF